MTWLIAKHVGHPALCFAFKQTMGILSWANVGDPARFKEKKQCGLIHSALDGYTISKQAKGEH